MAGFFESTSVVARLGRTLPFDASRAAYPAALGHLGDRNRYTGATYREGPLVVERPYRRGKGSTGHGARRVPFGGSPPEGAFPRVAQEGA